MAPSSMRSTARRRRTTCSTRSTSVRPPTSKLARQQIRGRLVTALRRKFKEFDSAASPAKTADAWLQEGRERDRPPRAGVRRRGDRAVGVERRRRRRARRGARRSSPPTCTRREEQLVALTLWTAYSHVFDCFGVSPILDLSSPTKRCGKSTAVVRRAAPLPGAAPEREHHAGRAVPRGRGVEADAPDRRGGHVREDERRAPRDPQRGRTRATPLSWSGRRATRTSRGCSRPGRRRSSPRSVACRTRSRIARSGSS